VVSSESKYKQDIC